MYKLQSVALCPLVSNKVGYVIRYTATVYDGLIGRFFYAGETNTNNGLDWSYNLQSNIV